MAAVIRDSVTYSDVIANTEVITKGDHLVRGGDGYIYSANSAGLISQGVYIGKQYGPFSNGGATMTGNTTYNYEVTRTIRGAEKGVKVVGSTRARVGQPVYVTGATGAQTFTMTSGSYTKIGILGAYRSATDCDIIYQSEELVDAPGTKKIITVDAAYTANLDDDVIIADGNAAVVPVTLPSVTTCFGKEYTIKATDITNACTIVPDGAETIDGAALYTFTVVNIARTVKNDGTEWFII